MGLLPWPERLIGAGLVTGARRRGSRFLLGGAFAVCAAPCIGPVLGSILVLAGDSGTAAEGALLLAVYGAGLSVPFVLAGALFTPAMGAFRWLRDHFTAIRWQRVDARRAGRPLLAGSVVARHLSRASKVAASTLSSTRNGSSASRATGGGTLPAERRQRARRGVPPVPTAAGTPCELPLAARAMPRPAWYQATATWTSPAKSRSGSRRPTPPRGPRASKKTAQISRTALKLILTMNGGRGASVLRGDDPAGRPFLPRQARLCGWLVTTDTPTRPIS